MAFVPFQAAGTRPLPCTAPRVVFRRAQHDLRRHTMCAAAVELDAPVAPAVPAGGVRRRNASKRYTAQKAKVRGANS